MDTIEPAHEPAHEPGLGPSELLDRVRKAWAEVLDVDVANVPVDGNFLEAGGSSLLLIMLWEELEGLTDGDLKVSDLFRHSTVRAQAALLAGEIGDVTDGSDQAVAGRGGRDRRQLLGRARGSA